MKNEYYERRDLERISQIFLSINNALKTWLTEDIKISLNLLKN